MKEKYALKGIDKIGYLDIEATNLKANFGFILSWAMIVRNPYTNKIELKYDVVNKKDFEDSTKSRKITMDARILKSLIKNIKGVNLLIGHYFHGWGKMDIPFIRTRCVYNGITDFPKYKEMRYGDTWTMAHKCYSLNSYRLDAVSDMLGVKTRKTPVTGLDWQLAQRGDKASLEYVLDHNIKDAKINYKVHKKIEEYVPIPTAYI